MKSEIINVRTGFVKKNRYGWDICDDDFWGTGYSHDINRAYLYADDGIPAKEVTTKISFEGHIAHSYVTKSGKFGAKCSNCHGTHRGKPKSEAETAMKNLLSTECSYTVREITLI